MESFAVLEPTADGFRNYLRAARSCRRRRCWWIGRIMLTLTAPEMTVLVGGLRVLNANFGQSEHGVFTERPGTLTNDFFVNLLDMNTEWKKSASARTSTRGATAPRVRSSGPAPPSTSSSVRTPSSEPSRKSMPCDDAQEKFVRDFVAAWDKVMNLDRFDLA